MQWIASEGNPDLPKGCQTGGKAVAFQALIARIFFEIGVAEGN